MVISAVVGTLQMKNWLPHFHYHLAQVTMPDNQKTGRHCACEKVLQPKGKRTKPIRLVASFEQDQQTVQAVDQAVCRHLMKFGFFQKDYDTNCDA